MAGIGEAEIVDVMKYILKILVFFFQAEDGIRDRLVTGVQTCALPILFYSSPWGNGDRGRYRGTGSQGIQLGGGVGSETYEIGRASCRERV